MAWEVVGYEDEPAPAPRPGPKWEVVGYEDEPTQAPAPTIASEARGVASGFLRGAADLGGTVYDLANYAGQYNPIDIAKRWYTGEEAKPLTFGTSDRIKQGIEEVAGAPLTDARSSAGRIASTTAEYMPGMLLPIGGGTTAARAGVGALSGIAGGTAREMGAGPWGELGAALMAGNVPSLLKGSVNTLKTVGGKMIAPFTQQGQIDTASRIYQQAMSGANTSDDLVRAAANLNPSDELARFKTPAELTGDTGLAGFEYSVGRAFPEASARVAEQTAARQGVRQGLIDAVIPDEFVNMPEQSRGAILRNTLATARDKQKQIGSAAYGAVDDMGQTAIPMQGAAQEATESAAKYFPQGSKPMGKETQAIYREILDAAPTTKAVPTGLLDESGKEITKLVQVGDGTKPWEFINTLTSRAGQQRMNLLKGDKAGATEQAFVASLRSSLDNAAEQAAKSGKGFTPEQANKWLEARAIWKDMKSTYGKGQVGQVLKERGFGEFTKAESEIARTLFKSPESIKQFTKGVKNQEDAMMFMRGYAAKQITSKTPGRWAAEFAKNEEKLAALFPKDQLNQIKRVIDDLESVKAVSSKATAASKGQSVTAQVNTVKYLEHEFGRNAKLLNYVLQGVGGGIGGTIGAVTSGVPGAIIGTMMGNKLGAAATRSQEAIKGLLIEAAFDPKAATALLGKPTQQSVMAVLKAWGVDSSSAAIRSALPSVFKSEGETQKPTQEQLGPYREIAQVVTPTRRVEEMPASDELVRAVIGQESAGNPKAVSSAGAQGLMQLMPATGREWHKRLGLPGEYDPFDVEQNQTIGRAYLDHLLERYDENTPLALAAYNAGMGRVDAAIKKAGGVADFNTIKQYLPRETQKYIPGVLRRMKA